MDRLTRPAQGEDQDQSLQEHFLSSLSPLPIGRAAQLSWLWLVHLPAPCPTLDTSTASFSQTLSPHFPPPRNILILWNSNTMARQPKSCFVDSLWSRHCRKKIFQDFLSFVTSASTCKIKKNVYFILMNKVRKKTKLTGFPCLSFVHLFVLLWYW